MPFSKDTRANKILHLHQISSLIVCSFSCLFFFLNRSKFHHSTHFWWVYDNTAPSPFHLIHLKINIQILNTLQYIVNSSLTMLTMLSPINIPVGYAVDAILTVGTTAIS